MAHSFVICIYHGSMFSAASNLFALEIWICRLALLQVSFLLTFQVNLAWLTYLLFWGWKFSFHLRSEKEGKRKKGGIERKKKIW